MRQCEAMRHDDARQLSLGCFGPVENAATRRTLARKLKLLFLHIDLPIMEAALQHQRSGSYA